MKGDVLRAEPPDEASKNIAEEEEDHLSGGEEEILFPDTKVAVDHLVKNVYVYLRLLTILHAVSLHISQLQFICGFFVVIFRNEIRVSVSEEDSSLFIVGNSRPIPKKDNDEHHRKSEQKSSNKTQGNKIPFLWFQTLHQKDAFEM